MDLALDKAAGHNLLVASQRASGEGVGVVPRLTLVAQYWALSPHLLLLRSLRVILD